MARKKKVLGRTRKPLPGGHRDRVPMPTEDAQLKQAVRELSKPHQSMRHPDSGSAKRRTIVLKSGKTKTVFAAGHTMGRPKGSKNKVPSGIRASVRAILEEVVRTRQKTIRDAVLDGIQSGPRHSDRFLKLAAEYVDGKPSDNINLNARWNQDEIGEAKSALTKKLDDVLAVLLEKK